MERMGDILAKTATRRASQRGAKAVRAAASVPAAMQPPTRTAPATAPAASAAPATSPMGQPLAGVQRGAVTTPLTRRTPPRIRTTPRLASGTAKGTQASAAPTGARSAARPVADLSASASAARPPADVADMDRILELPRRRLPATPRPDRVVSAAPVTHAYSAPEPAEPTPQPGIAATSRRIPPVTRRAATAPSSAGELARKILPRRPASAPGQAGPASTATQASASTCALCGGTGFVRLDVPVGDPAFGQAVPCKCKERQMEERRRSDLRRLSSLEPFKQCSFEAFDTTDVNVREAFEVARRYAANPTGWLVLKGGCGVGKTHLAAAIANQHLAAGDSVFFSIVPDLLDHLRTAFGPSSELRYDEMFDKIREIGLLVLDDLGAENSTAWATEKLFQLINYRYNFRMPTVITTNDQQLARIDDRIRSRLSDLSFVQHVLIQTRDFRPRNARTAPRLDSAPERGRGGSPRGRGYHR